MSQRRKYKLPRRKKLWINILQNILYCHVCVKKNGVPIILTNVIIIHDLITRIWYEIQAKVRVCV